MRAGIGTAVIVLIAVLGGFGYLLYGYIDTSKELNIVNQQIAHLQQQNTALQEILNTANSDIEALNAQNNELEQQVLSWQEQVRQLEEQKQTLKEQKVALEQQKQTLEEKVANWEKQVIAVPSASANNAGLPKKTTNPLGLAFLVPVLPVTVVATYVVARQRTKNSIQKNQETHLNIMQRGNMVRLSDDEMKEIIKVRRGQ